MKVLAIESSCDETSCAIVQDSCDISQRILSNVIFSQIDIHKAYGGVVPEYAARSHVSNIDVVVNRALSEANESIQNMNVIAATIGPGLIGGLIIGSVVAKTIAACLNKPFMAINHLEGHILSPLIINDNINFPYLALLTSGGHFFFVEVFSVGNYKILGETLDDAAGEAFDKVANMLRLPYPGGPSIQAAASNGDKERFYFPMPLRNREGCDVSFSGLKTAAKLHIEKLGNNLNEQDRNDIAASFQNIVIQFIVRQMTKAIEIAGGPIRDIVISGGVAANIGLRDSVVQLCERRGLNFYAPPLDLCSDNAAMIGWCAIERINNGFPFSKLNVPPRPRWPITEIDK